MKGCLKSIPGFLNYFFKGYFVPLEIEVARETEEGFIMHLSDTPSFAYPSLINLIEILKPEVVVHTGDLADDIKLELYPELVEDYRDKVLPFLCALENSAAKDIYIVPGNHDLESLLREEVNRIHIVPDGHIISIKGNKLGLAHCLEDLPTLIDYGLYGHNLECPRESQEGLCVLNGLKTINIISYPSWCVYRLPYPIGTNLERKYEKINERLL